MSVLGLNKFVFFFIFFFRYPNYGSPLSSYGYNNAGPPLTSNMGGMQPAPQAQQPYDANADYADSTTPYDPKQTGFLDTDFISHGTFISSTFIFGTLKSVLCKKRCSLAPN